MRSRAAISTLVLLLLMAPAGVSTQGDTTAFVGMRLQDGTDGLPLDDAVILVREGKVVAVGPSRTVGVPADARRVSLAGKVVVPGLINAHGHVNNVDVVLPLYAKYGVTTVFSLGNDNNAAEALAARDQQNARRLPRSRVFTAGKIVAADTPSAARREVVANARSGVDLIKIRVDDNLGTTSKMGPEVYRAVIDEAHQRGLRVAAHMFYLDDTKGLLNAGVDLLAHSVRDAPVDAELIRALKARDVCVVPTLMRDVSTFVYESTPPFFNDPVFLRYANPADVATLSDGSRQQTRRTDPNTPRNKAAFEMASRNLRTLADAGVRIAMGTDTGAGLGRFTGFFELMELEMMVKAGLTPRQALTAATGGAARCMQHEQEFGTLAPGRWADMLVLNADPLADITNIRKIDAVYIAGQLVPR